MDDFSIVLMSYRSNLERVFKVKRTRTLISCSLEN
jgi:hypothetical protein